MLKKIIKSLLPASLHSLIRKEKHLALYKEWQRSGKVGDFPYIAKQHEISEYQIKYGYTIFIETGTYLGDMIEAQKSKFNRLISIELGVELANKAKNRFKKDKNILIIQGDSGKVLPKVMQEITEPAIFWLDGHYSAGETAKSDSECPIFEELDAIFNYQKFNHILLIDDARCFTGKGDYPTINQLTDYVKTKNSNYKVSVEGDIIRYVI